MKEKLRGCYGVGRGEGEKCRKKIDLFELKVLVAPLLIKKVKSSLEEKISKSGLTFNLTLEWVYLTK